MSSLYFTGGATAVYQSDRFTPANVNIGNTFTLTITGDDGSTKAVSFIAGAATVANVTAGLTAAWNAETHPLVTPITAADAGTSMTLTADAGQAPVFSVVPSATGGTATLTRAVVTVGQSPYNWWSDANWAGGVAPVAGDDLTVDGRAANKIIYGLRQKPDGTLNSSIAFASFTHWKSDNYDVGTVNAPLVVAASTHKVNKFPTDGSTPGGAATVNIDAATTATTVDVWGSNNSGASGLDPVMIKGANAANVLRIYGGIVGVATNKPADTANFPTINLNGDGARVTLASGLSTVTALTIERGKAVVRCAATLIDQKDGELVTEGAAAIGTANLNGAAALDSTGTITLLSIEDDGRVTTRNTPRAATITTAAVYGSGELITDLNTTYTNGVYVYRGASTSQVNYPDGTKIVASAAP